MIYSLSHRVLKSTAAVFTAVWTMPFDRIHISCTPRTAIAAVLQDFLSLQAIIPPKRFDIVTPVCGMLIRSRCFQIFLSSTVHYHRGIVHRPRSMNAKTELF